ncbi:hypothetical protein AAG570_007783 [Ranatra chinensis]|uniref:Uncharacterized protein n=1 Tax=Ranatra chinensis TaxID=642074 RepID=A0ABD0XWH6_9HEMI
MENRGKEERLILKKMRLTLVRALTVYMNEVISDISLTSASTSLSSTDLDGGGIETDYNTEYSTYRFDEDSMNTVVQRTVTPEGLSSSDASSGQDDSELRLHHINEPNETQSQCHLPYILINADSSIDIPFTTSEIDALESGILSDEVTPIGSAFDTSGTLCEAITVFFRYLSTYATDLITTGAGFVIACFHLIFRLVEELICPTTPVNETPEGEIDDDVWEISTSSYEDTPYQ